MRYMHYVTVGYTHQIHWKLFICLINIPSVMWWCNICHTAPLRWWSSLSSFAMETYGCTWRVWRWSGWLCNDVHVCCSHVAIVHLYVATIHTQGHMHLHKLFCSTPLSVAMQLLFHCQATSYVAKQQPHCYQATSILLPAGPTSIHPTESHSPPTSWRTSLESSLTSAARLRKGWSTFHRRPLCTGTLRQGTFCWTRTTFARCVSEGVERDGRSYLIISRLLASDWT